MTPRPERFSRTDVLTAALELIDADGLDQLTMRRLGTALGADPMTAYRHFAGKSDLAAALADEFWTGLSLPSASGVPDWRTYARELMRVIRAELAARSGLIPIVATHPITSPAALAVADEAIGILLDLGAPVDPALGDLVNVLVMITVASAMGEFSTPAGSESAEAKTTEDEHEHEHEDTEATLLSSLPHLGRIIAAGWAPSAERQFEAGIGAILHGWPFALPPAS
ncbi:TetR/AcrR family transcriptional regulator [Microbacterium sp. C5A9]|uniref:TetR/AcrR family transcriptional regulator n=1 Tax=Microbacterium sp. C5A9 TaxID=2736663 RepID=UPI001F521EF5|nr:helix-turn-helix domain-containing protein [Microbacterium sp. C5A9]MCI1017220.1 TetR/AcrR family transcriptional regulator [Microbacterium sp. C5A9]